MIAALVLAAGGSSRMGRPKQLLSFRGRPLVLRSVDAALAAGCRPVVVVLGAHAGPIGKALEGTRTEICVNDRWREGIAGSIRSGIAALQARRPVPRAVIIMTCDQPFISEEVVGRLIDAFDGAPGRMVACEYAGTVGVPALFEQDCFERLAALRGDCGAKSLLLADRTALRSRPWPEGGREVDTPEDYAALE